MALRATISKIMSCKELLEERRDGRRRITSSSNKRRAVDIGMERRGLLLSAVVVASQASESSNELIKKYLKKSEENKAKNDQERLDSYYKRNYKDYFEFVEGSTQGKEELSESEKGIVEWLKRNK